MNNYDSNVYNQGAYETSQPAVFAKLMQNVYSWMCLALVITGMAAWMVGHSFSLQQAILGNPIMFYGLMIGELVLVVWLSARINKISLNTAGIMFGIYSIVNGLTLGSVFLVYTEASIAQTFFITAGTFGGMSLLGYTTKKDLSTMGRILYMALIGLIIAIVVNIFFSNSVFDLLISVAGLIIFVGLTAYDTQKIKMMLLQAQQHGVTEQTSKIALIGSLSLYLDFINIFLYLLRLFGDRR